MAVGLAAARNFYFMYLYYTVTKWVTKSKPRIIFYAYVLYLRTVELSVSTGYLNSKQESQTLVLCITVRVNILNVF